MGRAEKLPPQLGQMPLNASSTQRRQNVHSNVQIIASCESGGRSQSQRSQFGRSASISGVAADQSIAEHAECPGFDAIHIFRGIGPRQYDVSDTIQFLRRFVQV